MLARVRFEIRRDADDADWREHPPVTIGELAHGLLAIEGERDAILRHVGRRANTSATSLGVVTVITRQQ